MNVEAAETSKSATDDESARQEDAAFNPDITDPQEQHERAGEGEGVSTHIYFQSMFLWPLRPAGGVGAVFFWIDQ